jgi:hypothetical protein
LEVDGYSIHFIKHDDGDNAREYDMDTEVWLPLLGHPLDARSTSAVAKMVSSFVMLPYVHESNVLSRIVIKVCMDFETQIPPLVAVGGCCDGVKIRTWTVPIYILSASSVTALGDEDGYPPFRGPAPSASLAPRWMSRT